MKTFDLLRAVRRLAKDPNKFKQQQSFILKSIKTNPSLQSFDYFTIYNCCIKHPYSTGNIINFIQEKVASTKNWVVLFKRVNVMLISSQINKDLIQQFHEYINMTKLSNVQIYYLWEMYNQFTKVNVTQDTIDLRQSLVNILSETMSQLSGIQLKNAISCLDESNNSIPFSQNVSNQIQTNVLQNLNKYSSDDLLMFEIFQSRSIFNKKDTQFFRGLMVYQSYSKVIKAQKQTNLFEIKQLISKMIGSLKINDERTCLQSQIVSSSDQRKFYYQRVKQNSLFKYLKVSDYQYIKEHLNPFFESINILKYKSIQSLIKVVNDNCSQIHTQVFINYVYLFLRSNIFIDLNKYPNIKTRLHEIMDNYHNLTIVILNILLHVLTSLAVQYPEMVQLLKRLDKGFSLKQQNNQNKQYKLTQLKLIGIQKSFVQAMPYLSNNLLKHFQYNISKRQAMFYNKLEYFMGKTKILPENTFKYPSLAKNKSFYEQKIISYGFAYKQLKFKSRVYHKGYQIDLMISHKDPSITTKVYIDICGAKHYYTNQYILRPNIKSKQNFLSQQINFEIISPDPKVHTNKAQLENIISKYFGEKLEQQKKQ